MAICLERSADLHAAQLMPLPLTVSCSSKIQTGFTFLVPAHPGSPGQRAVKRVCVCVCVLLAVILIEQWRRGRRFVGLRRRCAYAEAVLLPGHVAGLGGARVGRGVAQPSARSPRLHRTAAVSCLRPVLRRRRQQTTGRQQGSRVRYDKFSAVI